MQGYGDYLSMIYKCPCEVMAGILDELLLSQVPNYTGAAQALERHIRTLRVRKAGLPEGGQQRRVVSRELKTAEGLIARWREVRLATGSAD